MLSSVLNLKWRTLQHIWTEIETISLINIAKYWKNTNIKKYEQRTTLKTFLYNISLTQRYVSLEPQEQSWQTPTSISLIIVSSFRQAVKTKEKARKQTLKTIARLCICHSSNSLAIDERVKYFDRDKRLKSPLLINEVRHKKIP